jgi:hypothetical protein
MLCMPHKSWVRGLEPDITPRKRDMLLRRQPLIAKEHDPIFPQNPPDLGHFRPAGRLRQIDPEISTPTEVARGANSM